MKLVGKRKTFISLLFILFLAACLRIWQLGKIPSGHTNDEANYIYSAYSIWHTGRDLNKKLFPFSFNLFNSFSPVPVYLMAPFVGVLGLSPFSARLPFAIFGLGTVFLAFLIARKLFGNDFIALASAFVLAISPWHLQISKIAYDGTLALFFYTLGIYLFLVFNQKRHLYWSLIPFLLAFYSYHGTKVFFLFFIPFLIFSFGKEVFNRRKKMIFFVLGIFLILVSFLWISQDQDVNRQKIFIWNNFEQIAPMVSQERFLSSAPLSLKPIFSNKISTSFWLASSHYLGAFSPEFLFLSGEPGYNREIYGISSKHGVFSRGMMYLFELPLLLLGIGYLLKTRKALGNFILIGLLISALPSALAIDRSYGMRGVMMLLFLAMILGCGWYDFWQRMRRLKNKKLWVVALGSLALFCFYFISDYLYHFYCRYPIYGAESWLKSRREIVELMGREKSNYERVWITNAGDLLIQYAIFNKVDPTIIQVAYHQERPEVDNVSFIGDCLKTNQEPFDPERHLPENTLYLTHESCHLEEEAALPIKIITEVGEPLHTIWKIYEN